MKTENLNRLKSETVTSSPEETQALGRQLAAGLEPGDVIAMIGELGSGKTCIIQGICQGLDVADDVTSPTFTLINEYQGRLPVYHFDLYRLDDSESALDIGFDEYVDGDGVCLIEWADKFPEILPEDRTEIRLNVLDADRRELKINYLVRFST